MTTSPDPAPRTDNLPLLYQGLFTIIVRVQSGKQPIADAAGFRKHIMDLLEQIKREAMRLNYEPQDISETNYAVVAFLDEVVLNSRDPSRNEWSKLQTELYENAVAGESFFHRLNALRGRRDSAQLADLLEVYYLCLLLGYEGRYAVAQQGELRGIMEELRERIRRIRGDDSRLSPAPPPEPAAAPAPVKPPAAGLRNVRVMSIACVCLLLCAWVVLRLALGSQADDVRQAVQRSLVP